MIFYLLAGVLGLLGLVIAAQWLVNANPRTLATVIRWAAIGGLGVGTAFLAVTGRVGFAAVLATGLLPLLRRWLRRDGATARGKVSTVDAPSLRMTLDHESGVMDGDIRRGQFRGRRLGTMALAELLAFHDECCRDDPEAARLVEAFLDRAHPDWRGAAAKEPPPPRAAASGMTRDEAYRVLGLQPGAGDEEIRQAHRRLMQKFHPDAGGSDYLAAKINEAKDILL
jgi:hypothetical protein